MFSSPTRGTTATATAPPSRTRASRCIPPRKTRKVQHAYDRAIYKLRRKVENMFGRLKDWRRVATRYNRCAQTFMSAIVIAATVIFWL